LRIGIQTWGSDGDIRPFLALAGGLRAAGHEISVSVTSVDDKDYSALAAALDVELIKVVDRLDIDYGAFVDKVAHLGTRLRLPYLFFSTTLFPWQYEMLEVAKAQCARCDVAIGHFLMYPMRAAAARRGVPFLTVTLCHGMVPTAYRPVMGLPDLGRRLNFLEWKLVQGFFNMGLKAAVNEMWRREGLGSVSHVLPDIMFSDTLNLVAVSPVFCSEPPDWRAHRVSGFLNVPERAEPFAVPAALEEFLSSGEPPVYMSFGSSGQLIAERSAEIMFEAARLAGVRAIVQTSSPEYPPDTVRDGVYSIGPTPHHAVFPRCAAIVHHGGAGTTHSATRAGRPSVVVPFMVEQAFWGHELKRTGVAGEPLSINGITPAKLARRIRSVLANPEYGRCAQEAGRAMAGEDGVAKAVEMIEAVAESV